MDPSLLVRRHLRWSTAALVGAMSALLLLVVACMPASQVAATTGLPTPVRP